MLHLFGLDGYTALLLARCDKLPRNDCVDNPPESATKPVPTTPYPDTSDIIARKAEGRRALAALTFGEKIARMKRCASE